MPKLVDKFGREISYLRISITDRCNLRCTYCMPEEGICLKKREEILSYEEVVDICRVGAALGINKIRLTGGEPLVRCDICGLIAGIAKIPGIVDLGLTTNGINLRELAPDLKKAGLKRINVSLDSLDPDKYQEITRGGNLTYVLEGIEKAIEVGLGPIKINIVLMWGINDSEIEKFISFSHRFGVKLQFIQKMSLKEPKETAIDPLCSRPPDCSKCNRIRLMADGKFKPCLLSDVEIETRKMDLEKAIRLTVESKPEFGYVCRQREMVEIGG